MMNLRCVCWNLSCKNTKQMNSIGLCKFFYDNFWEKFEKNHNFSRLEFINKLWWIYNVLAYNDRKNWSQKNQKIFLYFYYHHFTMFNFENVIKNIWIEAMIWNNDDSIYMHT